MIDADEFRGYIWAMLPTIVVGAYGLVVLPTDPTTGFTDLALYQQAASVGAPLSLPWTFYRLFKLDHVAGVGES